MSSAGRSGREPQAIHLRLAQQFETAFSERLSEFYGLIAYHYTEGQQWEKAHEYLLKIGDQAQRMASDAEALASYNRAIEAHTRVFGERWEPLERACLERRIGEALFRKGNHLSAREHLLKARSLIGYATPRSKYEIYMAFNRESMRLIAMSLMPFLF